MNHIAAVLAVILGLVIACHQHVGMTVAGLQFGTSLAALILWAVIAVAAATSVVAIRSCIAGGTRVKREAA